MNEDNGGSFFLPATSIPITAGVANAGNADITEAFPVTAQIVQAGIPIPAYTEASTVDPIALGELGLATFPDFSESAINPGNPLTAGTYTLTTTSVLTGDLVNGNNETATEFVIVDTAPEQIILSYAAAATPDDAGSWTNGGGNSGFGVYYEPPFYPFTINAVEAFAIDGGAEPGTESEYTIRLYDDQSPNPGLPGNLLSIAQVPAGSYDNVTPGTGEWVLSPFPAPVTIMSGGFYVGWIMEGNNPALGLETGIPRSRRTLEFIGGGWAEYRSNNVSEAAIRVYGDNPFFNTSVDETLFANNISIFPNPSHHKVNISSTLEDKTIENIQLFNSIGQKIMDRNVNIEANQTYTMDLSKLDAGMYYLNLTADGTTISKKVTLVK